MVEVKRGVEFKILPYEFLDLVRVLHKIGEMYGFNPVITGASYENYEPESYHARGFAWDIRTHNVFDVPLFVYELNKALKKLSPLWYVKYENEQGNEHIHVAYKYDKNLVSPGY